MMVALRTSALCSLARASTFSLSPRSTKWHRSRASSSDAAVTTLQSSPSGRTMRCLLSLATLPIENWNSRDVISRRTSLPCTIASMKDADAYWSKISEAACSLTDDVGRRRGASPCRPWMRCVAWKVSRGMVRTGTRMFSPCRICLTSLLRTMCSDPESVRRMPPILGKALEREAMSSESSRSTRPTCVTISTLPPGMGSCCCWAMSCRNCLKVSEARPSIPSTSLIIS
mmetsp:Transcript_38741/g.95324  ORF Transcript_38741/g.95324 Transcript_38741/m.95324 type:complete len:229 (-) Transcript_38741:1348-2034(-)